MHYSLNIIYILYSAAHRKFWVISTWICLWILPLPLVWIYKTQVFTIRLSSIYNVQSTIFSAYPIRSDPLRSDITPSTIQIFCTQFWQIQKKFKIFSLYFNLQCTPETIETRKYRNCTYEIIWNQLWLQLFYFQSELSNTQCSNIEKMETEKIEWLNDWLTTTMGMTWTMMMTMMQCETLLDFLEQFQSLFMSRVCHIWSMEYLWSSPKQAKVLSFSISYHTTPHQTRPDQTRPHQTSYCEVECGM